MKIDRHIPDHHLRGPLPPENRLRHGKPLVKRVSFMALLLAAIIFGFSVAIPPGAGEGLLAQDSAPPKTSPQGTVGEPAKLPVASSAELLQQNRINAAQLVQSTLQVIANGPAFDAKVRETVHVAKREVLGLGTYEQAGGGTGRYHMELTMFDGDGKHRLSQISDGTLAWTRSEIAGEVALRRVDVARLDEWIPVQQRRLNLAPRLLVGGWTEMLLKLYQDYDLRLDSAVLSNQPVAVIIGDLKPEVRERIMEQSGGKELPELFPVRIQVAIATQNSAEHQFGKWLPIRWEYRSAPEEIKQADGSMRTTNGRLVTLIEMSSIRAIDPPVRDRFRFENREAEVNFLNETDLYMNQYGVQLTQREQRLMRR